MQQSDISIIVSRKIVVLIQCGETIWGGVVMKYFIIALSLAGCATAPLTPVQRSQLAASMTNPILCYYQAMGLPQDLAAINPELYRRGITCNTELVYMGERIVAQQKADQAAANAAFAQGLQNLSNTLNAPRVQTNCTTTQMPGSWTATTTCR